MKRVFDFLAAALSLLLLSPLLVLTALLVHIKLGSPVLFSQPRPGRNGRPFSILKFRTMTDRRDEAGNLLLDAERLTPFGRMLRGTSLDELPELINVLKGDMSLVGPRPLLMRYPPYYTERENLRHTVLAARLRRSWIAFVALEQRHDSGLPCWHRIGSPRRDLTLVRRRSERCRLFPNGRRRGSNGRRRARLLSPWRLLLHLLRWRWHDGDLRVGCWRDFRQRLFDRPRLDLFLL